MRTRSLTNRMKAAAVAALMCLSVFMAVSYCFDCCSFITTFQIKMCESDFVLLFKTQCFDNLILEMTADLPYFIH